MRKLTLSILIFLFIATTSTLFSENVGVGTIVPEETMSCGCAKQDSTTEILLPEKAMSEISDLVKNAPPARRNNPTGKDSLLAKYTGTSEFYYVSYNQEGWRELSPPQLFQRGNSEITGMVYNNGSKTLWGPSCYFTHYDLNYEHDGISGAAFACSSSKVFFFFTSNGVYYMAIIEDSGFILYSTE